MQTKEPGTCLFPLTVSLDPQLHDTLDNIWTSLETLAGVATELVFRDPGHNTWFNPIQNESKAQEWVSRQVFNNLQSSFNGLIDCAQSEAAAALPNFDSDLLAALRACAHTTVSTNDTRQLIPDDRLDELAGTAMRLGDGLLRQHISTNREAQRVLGEVVAMASQNESQNTYVPPTREEVVKARKQFFRCIPDVCLNWVPRDAPAEMQGAIPFISMEVKDPRKLSYDDLLRCWEDYGTYTTDPIERESFEATRVMNLRRMFTEDGRDYTAAPFSAQMKSILYNVSKHYQQMFFGRLTYGLFGTGDGVMSLRIDWDHATEPGQHFYIGFIGNNSKRCLPSWPDSTNPALRRSLLRPCLCIGGAQLRKDLIPMWQFERALMILTETHKGYLLPRRRTSGIRLEGDDDSDHDDDVGEEEEPTTSTNQSRRDDDDEPENGPGNGNGGNGGNGGGGGSSGGGRRTLDRAAKSNRKRSYEEVASEFDDDSSQPPSSSPLSSIPADFSPDERRLFLAFLEALGDTACQQVMRYLTLNDTKFVLPFPKRDLLKVFTAVFPLDEWATARLAKDTPLSQRRLRKMLRTEFDRPLPPLPPYVHIDDPDLFRWHTLLEGYLPKDFEKRVAEADLYRQARLNKRPKLASTDDFPTDHPLTVSQTGSCWKS